VDSVDAKIKLLFQIAKPSKYFSQKKFLDDVILNGLQYSIIVAILLPYHPFSHT
jgi:hypothetical protein